MPDSIFKNLRRFEYQSTIEVHKKEINFILKSKANKILTGSSDGFLKILTPDFQTSKSYFITTSGLSKITQLQTPD
jgi:hypothetical protein